MIRRRMGAIQLASGSTAAGLSLEAGRDHGPVVEEIRGLIRLHKDGHVERPPAVPQVPCTWSPVPDVRSGDVVIDSSTGTWARFYVPTCHQQGQQQLLPLLVYFHGGGFCVGSAAWSCYHEFLARLASHAGCVVMSVNYRLAPEHRLPACYEDGLAAVKWARRQQQAGSGWWRARCDMNRVYLGGDSAGAAAAYNVSARLCPSASYLRGLVLIQPFFGGEARTGSEKSAVQPPKSALSLATSDCYWRLALPAGADRDHPWCNPLGRRSPKLESLGLPPALVCISEADILKDRNLEFCRAMRKAGKTVEHAVYAGVGHGFQVLHNYHASQARTQEMLTHIKSFLSNYR
ncbi:Uncharacterized protein M6B38_221215 [Iris pallida]|uniref:Alpha/beta hydrolase fold-3 domain-containing protein n=1 Tax=Iris pallida TaxID=29817 RepID=A0AAX6DYR2_IRIPA|nr:Uncharacterized protein M6B38_221215 [Iris pallida]